MPSKLENALPLFISVRKLVGSVLTSGLAFNLEFLMLFNGNYFPDVTFFLKNAQKATEE